MCIFKLNLIEFENLPPNLVGNCVEYTKYIEFVT